MAQIPFSVLDQRLHAWPSLLERLRQERVELHIRSVFLQGLLLEDPERIDPYFAPLRSVLTEFRRRATGAGLPPLEMAIRFAMTASSADVAIIGACSVQQLTEIIGAAGGIGPLPDLRDLAVADEALVNPSLWTLARP
jgi:aryl-alcohol dehydrogenase-like predicted oxidoreductase